MCHLRLLRDLRSEMLSARRNDELDPGLGSAILIVLAYLALGLVMALLWELGWLIQAQ